MFVYNLSQNFYKLLSGYLHRKSECGWFVVRLDSAGRATEPPLLGNVPCPCAPASIPVPLSPAITPRSREQHHGWTPSTDLPDKSPVTGSLTIRNEWMRNPKRAQENTELYDTFEVCVTHPRFDRLIKLTASPEKGKPR